MRKFFLKSHNLEIFTSVFDSDLESSNFVFVRYKS